MSDEAEMDLRTASTLAAAIAAPYAPPDGEWRKLTFSARVRRKDDGSTDVADPEIVLEPPA